MKIHFVSYGHVFRSRLAEAYLKYLLRKSSDHQISSSGIKYSKSINGPIAWYAMKILLDHQLTAYMSDTPVLTTKELLTSQDKVIFMDEISEEYCERHFKFKDRNSEVWNVEYIPPEKTELSKSWDKDIYIIQHSEMIFKGIMKYCQRFADSLSSSKIPFNSDY